MKFEYIACILLFALAPQISLDILLPFLQLVNHVYFSPDGQWIASGSFDKSVKLWNGITGKFVAAFRGHVGPVYQIRF